MDAVPVTLTARAARGMLGPKALEFERALDAQPEITRDVAYALMARAYFDGLMDATQNPARP